MRASVQAVLWGAVAGARPMMPRTSRVWLQAPRYLSTTLSGRSKGASHNAWIGHKGPGAFDLRSDTTTTPTPAMLAAVQSCTLLDDVLQEDPTTLDLEAHVASLTGKEAALFVTSGTMGNQLGLRTLLTQPPYGVLCDDRSHIVQYEAGGVSSLSGASVKTVLPRNGVHLTLEDVATNAVIDDDVHSCPTRVISLENTLNGMVMPLNEIRRISAFAQDHGIRMHCDGARLWEAVAAGAGTLPQFCDLFDTVTLCFSKGLGAPVGSILVGTEAAMKHSRWVRKSLGGGMRQPGLLAACARVAVDETFGAKVDGGDSLLRATHELAKKVERLWTAKGGKLVHPVHTNMCWLDLDAAGCSPGRFIEYGKEVGLKLMGNRLVLDYQVAQHGDEVLRRLYGVFSRVFSEPREDLGQSQVGKGSMYRV